VAAGDIEKLVGQVNQVLEAYGSWRVKAERASRLREPHNAIGAPVPHVRWNQRGPGFAFGVAAGWRDLEPSELDILTNLLGVQAVAGIVDWTGRNNISVANAGAAPADEADDLLAFPEALLEARARNVGGTPLPPPARVLLGGDRAVLIHFKSWLPGHLYGQRDAVEVGTSDVFAVHAGQAFIVAITGPDAHEQSRLDAFYTALGTWTWGY
jgi:hypothetical protein